MARQPEGSIKNRTPRCKNLIRDMTKLREITPADIAKHYKQVQEVFALLDAKDVNQSDSGFSADKDTIVRVFNGTNGCDKADLLVRLTLIDSMYSTQMSRRYYALDELAEALVILADGKKDKLERDFLAFAKNPEKNLKLFDYIEIEGKNKVTKNLFSECYGIGKDGADKGVAISLISKYAYFLTGFKFPIYDSIACEMYPLVCHFCGWNELEKRKLTISKGGKVQGAETMISFVNAINSLIAKLGCKGANYDLLDRFLWFVGKIRRGNLSLVLTREEYEKVMQLYPAQTTTKTKNGKEKTITEYFNIERVDIDKLNFLKKNKTLKLFFVLAKFYGHKK